MSEPTYRAQCYIGAGCLSNGSTYLPGTVLQWCRLLSGVRTYLPSTVLHWCRLFKQCQNLPTGHCVTVTQTVKAVSEPTYSALCYSGADCLSNVSTTYRALCYIGAGCLSSIRTYLPSTVLQWCRLFKGCLNPPAEHCVAVVQTVLAVSEPTYQALCYSSADCFSNVTSYLPGTLLQLCRLF